MTAAAPLDPAFPPTGAEGPLHERLERTWHTPKTLWGWITTVDPKMVGRRYIATGLAFFVLGGLLALVMRTQLAQPESGLIDPDRYNQLFSMHGSTMMFLFAVPIMEAMAVFLVPLMVGARTIAFPRLNAFSYWLYLSGGVLLYAAFVLNIAPEAGWTAYVPLSGPEYSPGKRSDIWAQLITYTEVSGLAVAVEIIATVLKMRAPGMTLARMPLFVWGALVTSFMVVFAMPAVMLASSFLISDRLLGTHFYNYAEGGSALLFQHLFWFFGHPEVYIIFIPGLGMVSQIVACFSRRTVFGYPAMVLALCAIGFMAFGLWVHHMFATGLPHLGDSFYTAASMTIALPSGIQIFCWIATLWDGRPRFQTPLLYVIAFIVVFVLGGLSGVMLASVPLDLQVHDSFFVVAHFHYVLIGGAVFPLLGGIHFWFPKAIGRMPSETAGKWAFWLIFVGFNVTFFPMHILGLLGMPRRVYTYPAELHWGGLNLLATAGAFLLAAGIAVYLLNLIVSARRGRPAGPNPWDAPGLEWACASPPPSYNFAYAPVVEGREPLWDAAGGLKVLSGLSVDSREVLLTSVAEAKPQVREGSPTRSLWPLLTALGIAVMFVWSIFNEWAVVWGSIPPAICLVGWFWPRPSHKRQAEAEKRRGAPPADAAEGAAPESALESALGGAS